MAYKILHNNTDPKLVFNLGTWSGGWLNNNCPKADRYGFFGVVTNGKMLIGQASDKPLNCKEPGRGLNLVVLSLQGSLLHHSSYDTHGNTYMSYNFVKALRERKTNNGVLIIGVHDEAANRLSTHAKDAIASLGAKHIYKLLYRGSYLLVYHGGSRTILYEGIENCGDVKYSYDCGLRCEPLYNEEYYKNKYNDINLEKSDEIYRHWESFGINDGRRASVIFDASTYGDMYEDLSSIKNDNRALAKHFMTTGLKQGRIGAFDIINKFDGLITNYLVCYLDARNKGSLVNGAKQWRDLSGKANHFNFQMPIVCDGRRADMSSCGQGTGPDVGQLAINGGSYTIIMVMRDKYPSSSSGFYLQGGIKCAFRDKKVYFNNTYTDIESYKTQVYAFTRTPTGETDIYINGLRKVKGEQTKTPKFLGNAYLGYNEIWYADMQVLLVYNTSLPVMALEKINEWYQKTNLHLASALASASDSFIPTRGLALAIDAGNEKCYKSGETTVRDLSGRALDLKFTKAPRLKNRAWISDGSNMSLSGSSASLLGISEDDDYTLIVRCRTDVPNSSTLFYIPGFYPAEERSALSFTPTHRDGNLYWDQEGSHNRIQHTTRQNALKLTTYCMVRNSQGRHLYIDGELVKSSKERGGPLVTMNKPLEIFKRSSGEAFQGALSHIIMYRLALTPRQIQEITRYINSPYIIKNNTWDQSLEQCSKTSHLMCDIDNLCYSGKTIDLAKIRGALAPIGSQQDTWVNLDTCQLLKKTGVVNNAHIKCCPIVKRVNKYFTAACNFKNTVYFFKESYVLEYLVNGQIHQAKKPKTIQQKFPGIPDAFKSDIGAAGIAPNGHMYLFKDTSCMVYDVVNSKVITAPGTITSIIGSQTLSALPSDYDSVSTLGTRIIFFKNGQIFQIFTQRVNLSAYIPNHVMDTGVDAWMRLSDGNQVAIREGYLYHFNTHKMMPLLDYFYDLRPPFVSLKERCISLDKTKRQQGHSAKRLRSIAREQQKYCKTTSMYEYKNIVKTNKDKIGNIKKSIITYRDKQSESAEKSKLAALKLNETERRITELEREIALAKDIKCPVNENCKKSPLKNIPTNRCTASMIKQVLLKHGYNNEQINKLSLDKGSIDDFDIRTHQDFYAYTKRDNVMSCPTDISTLRKGNMASTPRKALSSDVMEKKALQILKDSVRKYGDVI